MPLVLELTPSDHLQIDRLLGSYQGVFRMEMLKATRDIVKLKARIAQLETAAKLVCDQEGKYGDKFIRVPHDAHAALCEAVRA